ncbi:hypothetical protein PB2503_10499 [Parvularcula bermudensis HTCC2503]|uniref:Bacterial sugar transferase domain-containing protein n=1 Tax=Parvularcula bermudensis (strain ATCC BAA-594 / HTCC2503 / KCTC 12087) TaxID=314260 RepID=E0TGL9_PARBH|nr:sugar transferase [Parvularcula bermudensis]ADM10151.1 hypothetical protein PB2503_10499 [Parvularcula bermudensis HTCC2503]
MGTGLSGEWAKRALDLACSAVLMVFTLPLWVAVAVAIKSGDGGPIFYRQTRLGRYRQPFTVLKFRTMVVDAEREGAQFAQTDDPRITAVGRFLRKTRLDELPQLILVLRGEMSLVGPRPERPEFVPSLEAVLTTYGERFAVKPGITGLAQISCRYAAEIEEHREKLKWDLDYIAHRSLALDIIILLKTFRIAFFSDLAR